MSSIPNAKMKHAHVPEGGSTEPAPKPKKGKAASLSERARDLGERAQDLAGDAVEVVKDHPKTAAGIGAAIVAGAAALVGGPALARKLKGDDKKPAAKPKKGKKG